MQWHRRKKMNKLNFTEMTDEELKKVAEKARRTLATLNIQRRRRLGNLEELRGDILQVQEILGVIEWNLMMRKIVSHKYSTRKCIPI